MESYGSLEWELSGQWSDLWRGEENSNLFSDLSHILHSNFYIIYVLYSMVCMVFNAKITIPAFAMCQDLKAILSMWLNAISVSKIFSILDSFHVVLFLMFLDPLYTVLDIRWGWLRCPLRTYARLLFSLELPTPNHVTILFMYLVLSPHVLVCCCGTVPYWPYSSRAFNHLLWFFGRYLTRWFNHCLFLYETTDILVLLDDDLTHLPAIAALLLFYLTTTSVWEAGVGWLGLGMEKDF